MHDSSTEEAPDLGNLYELTTGLLSDEEHITRALDWVDNVLPDFAAACRTALLDDNAAAGPAAVDRWMDWLSSDASLIIEEAGKGEVFAWRIGWMRTLLEITRRLSEPAIRRDADAREQLAREFFSSTQPAFACFPLTYWQRLIDYLASTPSSAPLRHSVIFPLVLSEPIVDAGAETNVILAQFLLETDERTTGDVYLSPEQTVMRCVDAKFADTFRDAGRAAKIDLPDGAGPLPAVGVRVQTLKPGHERFLVGATLRGESGGGALAVALRQLYTARAYANDRLAISFALRAHGSTLVDGKCHNVSATDEKVRGCAKQGITNLLVARAQQGQLVAYARKHNVQLLGVTSVAEATDTVSDIARPGAMPRQLIATLTAPAPPATAPSTQPSTLKVVVLHYRRFERDRRVSKILEDHLKGQGHEVFVDRYSDVGITWAREIEQHIRDADVVLPMLSAASVVSEMLAQEILTADEARQQNGTKPRLIPVRIDYSGPVPDSIAYVTESIPPVICNSEGNVDEFLAVVDAAIADVPAPVILREERRRYETGPVERRQGTPPQPAAAEPSTPVDLEPFAGLVPLNSPFYIERDADAPFLGAVEGRHSVILVKGARQMGKSSLLARGMAHAEKTGARTAFTDFQKLSMADLQSLKSFYLALARMFARQLKVDVSLDETWVDHRSPNLNFEEYFEDFILPTVNGEIVWAMDEVDKLFFSTDFSSDVFGLLRSWANERQGRASSPWAGVTMMIAYATEAHLFITDINQSPFNVGTRFEMQDFTKSQVAELNRRYGGPIARDVDLDAFFDLVAGHPYLVRRSLYAMVTEKLDVQRLKDAATSDNGPLSDHLRRILTLLARNPDNVAAIREILNGRPCPNFETFYHLRSAGVLLGETVQNARIRCNLYRTYLARHLQ